MYYRTGEYDRMNLITHRLAVLHDLILGSELMIDITVTLISSDENVSSFDCSNPKITCGAESLYKKKPAGGFD